MSLIVVAVHRPCPSKIHAHLINEQRLYLGCSSSEAAEPPAAPSQAPQGPSTSSPGNHHKLHNEGCQQTIGECLIRHSPILVDAIMLGFLPLSSTLLASFYSPSVSHQPPPVRSRHAPSQRGPRSRPHPGPQRPGCAGPAPAARRAAARQAPNLITFVISTLCSWRWATGDVVH